MGYENITLQTGGLYVADKDSPTTFRKLCETELEAVVQDTIIGATDALMFPYAHVNTDKEFVLSCDLHLTKRGRNILLYGWYAKGHRRKRLVDRVKRQVIASYLKSEKTKYWWMTM